MTTTTPCSTRSTTPTFPEAIQALAREFTHPASFNDEPVHVMLILTPGDVLDPDSNMAKELMQSHNDSPPFIYLIAVSNDAFHRFTQHLAEGTECDSAARMALRLQHGNNTSELTLNEWAAGASWGSRRQGCGFRFAVLPFLWGRNQAELKAMQDASGKPVYPLELWYPSSRGYALITVGQL